MILILNKISAALYLVAIILYVSQGILFEGTWYTFLSGIYLLVFNMFSTLKIISKKNYHPIFRLLVLFISWLILIWIISPKSQKQRSEGEIISTLSMVQYSIIICSSVFSFYYIAINRLIKEYQLKTFTLLLGSVYVYNVLNFDVAGNTAGDYDFSTVNNKSYSIVALFPLLSIFWNKKWMMILIMTLALFLITFCLKRGAIIIALLCYGVSLFYVFKGLKASVLKKRLMQLVIIILLGGVVSTFFSIYNTNELLQARIEMTMEGETSSRDYIYTQIWDSWNNSDIFTQMIGHGPISTLSVAINYAHNDWLEILYDFGLIGLVLYIGCNLTIINFWRKENLHIDQKLGMLLCIIYISFRSSFSMCVYELDSLLVFGYIGYIMGEKR